MHVAMKRVTVVRYMLQWHMEARCMWRWKVLTWWLDNLHVSMSVVARYMWRWNILCWSNTSCSEMWWSSIHLAIKLIMVVRYMLQWSVVAEYMWRWNTLPWSDRCCNETRWQDSCGHETCGGQILDKKFFVVYHIPALIHSTEWNLSPILTCKEAK